MKSILTLVLFLMNIACLSANTGLNSETTLTLEGEFIAERNVHYEVYTINTDNTLNLIDKGCGIRWFTIKVEVGKAYLIKFISKANQVKYLYIEADQNGNFMFDVDFNSKNSAKVFYDRKDGAYNLTLVDIKQFAYVKTRRNNN